MEEIGFIYVLALSILLLSSIFYTIRDTTETKKESTSITFYEDAAHHITGVVQDVIEMHITHPELSYTRVIELRHPGEVYQYWIKFSDTTVTFHSRVKTISVSVSIYNPDNISIDETVSGDVDVLSISYDEQSHSIRFSVSNP